MSRRNQKSAQELALFCTQCALVLRSGMLLSEGLMATAEENQDRDLRFIAEELSQGGTLESALKESGAFPSYMVSLAGIGERTGSLEEVMDALALYYQREHALRHQLKNTLFHPLLLALVMLCVVAVLLLKVLPVFSDVYAQLGGASGLTAGVLTFGRTAGIVCLALTGLLAFLGVFAYFASRTPSGYERLTQLLTVLPFARRIADRVSSGRVAYALSLLLSSGYDIDDAVPLLSNLVSQPAAVQKIHRLSSFMERGEGFSAAARESGLFLGMYGRLVGLGVQSGTLDEVMARLSVLYDAEIEEGLSSILGAVEPTIVAVLSAIIGTVLLSVMLPLLEILSAF
ncbi:MAG: type II secretion system F family protein [Christensenellales bacterium]|jgi:type IV pilus assembly protein PilC